MSRKMFGIDFGTSQFKMYKKGTGIVMEEKEVIAISKKIPAPGQVAKDAGKKRVIAGGNQAFEMFEKAPANIRVSYPVRNGVIADIENMQLLFNYFLKRLSGGKTSGEGENGEVAAFKGKAAGAEYLLAVPTDVTEVEKRAFFDLIKNSDGKPKKVFVVEKPIAAAVGLGLEIMNARGVMTVDIGADTTELSIMSLGGIVISKLIPVGGRKLDESIKIYIKKNHNMIIGDKTAETIKRELACAHEEGEKSIRIYGRHIVTGLPAQMELHSPMIYGCIREHLKTIVDSIRVILERTPPEISSDIIKSGIYVTGGSAKIRDIDRLISEETELAVNINGECENSVVNGLGAIMDRNMTELMKQPDYMAKKEH